jgi:flagellar biosynthesis GTPase FlhF
MDHPNTLRACAIAGALVVSSAAGVLAQGSFQINGRVKVEGGGLDDAHVVVYKNGEKQRTISSGLSKFQLDLDINADYILAFEKDGFVTKKLSFNTHAPAEAIANGFTPFEFAVSMFKQYDGVNTVVFNQPVGMIRYDKTTDDFDYDTDYTKSIQSALEKTLQEVAAKQELEKNNDAEEAKRAEEEAKAKAKAEADKAKQDAELAKQKAKADKDAAEAAKSEQEQKEADAKKAEAAAKKAEQERLAAEAKKKEEPKPEPEPKPKPAPKADPPPPVAKAKPVKTPKPPPPPPVIAKSNGQRVDPKTGDDSRRGSTANEGAEESPLRSAEPTEVVEAKPELRVETPEVVRNEELIVEPNQVITRIELDNGKERTEYRKVVHKYGPTFYFKDGQSISKLLYESEALADNK